MAATLLGDLDSVNPREPRGLCSSCHEHLADDGGALRAKDRDPALIARKAVYLLRPDARLDEVVERRDRTPRPDRAAFAVEDSRRHRLGALCERQPCTHLRWR